MNELRLLFDKSADGYTVRLENNWGGNAGAPAPLTFALTEDDQEDLRWYLEDFMDLPLGGAQVRAQRVERNLADWGRRLYDTLFRDGDNRELLNHLQEQDPPRLLTIATRNPDILHLPWEMMADSRGPLFRRDITIRRQLETARKPIEYRTGLPLRVLVIVSRPGDLGFIDPRLSTRSMLDALEPLGDDVRVDFCRPPTLTRMEEILRAAKESHKPYAIVHFDGHGTFLPEIELGALCFEKPDTAAVLAQAKTDYVRADRIGDLLAAYEIPLVILEACRTGTIGKVAVFRSVAPRLIESGVGSVISMSHAVHVEAARILLAQFYRALVKPVTVGQALEQGRGALLANPHRRIEYGPGARTVELKDWYLPHLYQRGRDLMLVPEGAVEAAAKHRPAARETYEYDAFLSYTHADAGRVRAIHKLLTDRHGLRVFRDEKEMTPGPLHEQCREGTRKSRLLLLACSRRSLASDWVMAEHDMARARDPRGRNIIPLVLDDVPLPLDLKALLWLDFQNSSADERNTGKLAELIEASRVEGGEAVADASAPAVAGRFRLATRDRDAVGAFPRAPVYGFQGRARELYDLERQFRSHRAVLLHAMGGMGKTALATEAAFWWTRTGLFPDGACFVSFEQFTSAERIIQVLGTYLEGNDFNALSGEKRRERAKELFRDKHILMVWDNFESVLPTFQKGERQQATQLYSDDERNRIYELFHAWTESEGNGRLLITCRPEEAGLPGARRTELQGLARADGLWLLVRVLETAGVEMDRHGLTRERLHPLLDLLADHPLSIELVGPHLKGPTPEEICTDFGRLLAEFKTGEGKERNESLLASLEFSKKRLSKEAQEAIKWLGLFSGGVFEQVLLAVSEMDPKQWEAVRAELEATALIRVERDIDINGRPYLRFHPTLAYAAAAGEVPDQRRKRFIGVYLAVRHAVDKALRGSQPRGGMEVLAREEANYRTAVRWAVTDQAYDIASALGGTFAVYLQMSGRLREWDAWVTWLAAEVGKGGFTKDAASYERQQAWSLFTQGHPQEAIEKLQALVDRLKHTTEFDPAFELATAQLTLGRVLYSSGLAEQAISELEAALRQWEALVEKAGGEKWETLIDKPERSKAAGELGNLAATLGDLANALCDAGRLDEALQTAEKGMAIDENLGRDREVATRHVQCAQILMAQGRYAEADARYEVALAAARRAGDKGLEGTVLQHQGLLARAQNQLDRAASLYQRALKLFQEMNAEGDTMRTCNLLGVVERKSGRLAEARTWYERSREIARRLGDTVGLGQAAQNIGIVCQKEGEAARRRGDEETARARFREALCSLGEANRIDREQGNEPFQAQSHGQLARVHLLLGELDEAERHANQAREIMERLGMKELVHPYNALADIARARGEAAQAGEWERKRDAARAELERRARGGSGLPAQFLRALQGLSVACAQAGFGQDKPQELDPGAESALAQIEKLDPPMPEVASFLRRLAGGELPVLPAGLPDELRQFLEQLLAAAKEAKP
jgi:tetratricopeptide (TPR) repeat protein